ncbi:OmpP1/FadL family transporter [Fusobacterium sp.]|uniref:OmpP1/FadL family transporter n=1 Tax=Fusobacterium sp. TaxID=68766 RepID=UPI002E7656C4|nr:outer membrane protein transport protein [Fusobacterium sp.]MEE1476170.1 outer membrane protein transport protein [Fusobacterium sp.]
MKKKLGILAIAALLSTGAYAASIDHIQTYTPEYLGNQSQNGMINKSSVYYNPAGLVHLDNGTYFHIGAQLAVGHEKMDYNGKEYKADLLQYIPTLALYSVRDERTIFWTFGGLGGGGDLEYKDGVPGEIVASHILNDLAHRLSATPGLDQNLSNLLKNANFIDKGSSAEGKSLYGQTTIGRAWKVNDKLSMSIAGRAVLGMKKLKGDINLGLEGSNLLDKSAHIDSDRTAWGLGAQIGFNYKATDRLNLAMRYDSRVKLNFKASGDEKKVDLKFGSINLGEFGFSDFYSEYTPGTKTRRDLPAILALGASYKVTDRWTTAISGNYYFNKDAKMDRTKASPILEKFGIKDIKAEYDNGWEIALGNEYKLNEKWTLLGSVNYAHTGAKVSSYDDIEFALDSVTVGAGVKYVPTDCDEWVFTVCHFFYDQESGHYGDKYPQDKFPSVKNPEYDKSITAFGLAYTKKF